jgi:flavin reductase (DIM6/NTAB) family NADH-FMN oxidoreductase RutF
MFYEPDKNDHGLPYNPFKSICVPRPIAWVSSLSLDGVLNLAPFSQFQNLAYDPPYVMFAPQSRTDTTRNIHQTGEFVINMATYALREQVNLTSSVVPPEVNEAALAGLEMIPSRLVRPPRVKLSPVQLECRLHTSLTLPQRLPDSCQDVIIGRVVGVHIADDALTPDGRIDVVKIRPLARLGYLDYTSIESSFTMPPPDGPNVARQRRGLEGRPEEVAPADAAS